MKSLKTIPSKHAEKKERERRVLLGLVDLYITSGKPVGSNTLKNEGFDDLSSATIRNYFVSLEKSGFLKQEHSSAGRIPTDKAYQVFAEEHLSNSTISENDEKKLQALRKGSNKEVARYLRHSAELLSDLTHYAVFLSAPRFDHDFIIDVKLMAIDQYRSLCAIVTNFGLIKTETLHTERKLTAFSIKRIESYFHWRLTGQDEPTNLDEEELLIAQNFYNEVIVRYIVGYSHFTNEDLYLTGFSQLLSYPEFENATTLASGLSLFENPNSLKHMLRECSSQNCLKHWIGGELTRFSPLSQECTAIAIPYYINNKAVGSIGLLGPMRMPYRELFGILKVFSAYVSQALTKDIYKYKISYREPNSNTLYLDKEDKKIILKKEPMLLENKSKAQRKKR